MRLSLLKPAPRLRHAEQGLERQYTHIQDGLQWPGRPGPLAEEIAARVVNKDRAQSGESVQASAASLNDMPASRRGGLRSHQGPGERTMAQLHNEARADAPLHVSDLGDVARARLMTVAASAPLVGVATRAPDGLLSTVLATMHQRDLVHVLMVDAGGRVTGVVDARDGLRARLAAGNQAEALLRNDAMGSGDQSAAPPAERGAAGRTGPAPGSEDAGAVGMGADLHQRSTPSKCKSWLANLGFARKIASHD